MERNPYERRSRDERGGAPPWAPPWRGGESLLGDFSARPHFQVQQRSLALEDLDAMANSAVMRGRAQASERLTEQHREELEAARRRAWEEGHSAGVTDGRRVLLVAIDRLHGEQVRDLIVKSEAVLAREKATRQELQEALGRTVRCLQRLVDDHHEASRRRTCRSDGAGA